MSSLMHRSVVRRTRRQIGLGHSLNLVPLIDVLTAIVFFGLLTYTGARTAALTSFDLAMAPAMSGAGTNGVRPVAASLTLRVDRRGVSLARAGESAERRFEGFSVETLQRLNRALAEYALDLAPGATVSVVPSDDLRYDDLIRVLDEVRAAGQPRIALGVRPRA
jgi:biopolymer transport protein ExbD